MRIVHLLSLLLAPRLVGEVALIWVPIMGQIGHLRFWKPLNCVQRNGNYLIELLVFAAFETIKLRANKW